jgi:hypothetical protein
MASKMKIRTLLAVIAMLTGAALHGAKAGEHQPYLPLSGVAVLVAESQSDDFLSMIRLFSEQHRFTIEGADIPKQGRSVVNINIRVDDKTFFAVNNFRSANRFELTAYSHDPTAWKEAWDALVSELSSKFGSAVVPYTPY